MVCMEDRQSIRHESIEYGVQVRRCWVSWHGTSLKLEGYQLQELTIIDMLIIYFILDASIYIHRIR